MAPVRPINLAGDQPDRCLSRREQQHMTRAEFRAQAEEERAAWEREFEFRAISRQLEKLYERQAAGDASTYVAQRVDRLERVQQCLMGQPQMLAG